MHYFMCRLTPPRKTFPHDMSDLERELMRQHVQYWTELLKLGKVLLFGPVDDPDGSFGLSILALSNEPDPVTAAAEICQNDPVQRGKIGFSFQIFAMPKIVHSFMNS